MKSCHLKKPQETLEILSKYTHLSDLNDDEGIDRLTKAWEK